MADQARRASRDIGAADRTKLRRPVPASMIA